MFPHLSGWRVNISLLQEAASKQLAELVEKSDGSKIIVWGEGLSGPVGLIAQPSFLKERNVMKNLPLRGGDLPDFDVKHVIFITRPNLKCMDMIAENVHSESRRRKFAQRDFHLCFLPRKSLLCEQHLKHKGVYGSFASIDEFPCDFFPVDSDVISMELPDAYKELVIEGDQTCLFQAATGLVNLQKIYGRIPKIYGKGNFSSRVWELAKGMGREERSMFNSDKGSIDQMILLDRSIDLMSVLATQLTYEGLIDENFGIKQTTVQLPGDKFSKGSEERFTRISTPEMKTFFLNSGEEIYVELRDKNFNEVGKILSRHAKSISSQLEERHSDKSVQEMKKFVERLPIILGKKQSVATHTTIAEMIKEITDSSEFCDDLAAEQEFMICADIDKPSSYIEDLIAKKADFRTVIRLICIQCIAASGLKPKILDYYKRELVHVYGVESLLTISSLERAGILKIPTEARPYVVLRKRLNLTVDEAIEISPKDISYVHSFYAPLSIRIIEQSLKPMGWQALKGDLNILPGPMFEDFQAPLIGIGGRRASLTSEISSSDIPRVILVFFLGGCTFAEISALRFLAQQEENNVEFIVATTKIVNKNTFLGSFHELLAN